MKTINGDRYYDTYECAAILGVSRYTIYNLRQAGRLPVSRLGARDYTREADIAAYLHAAPPARPRKRDRDRATARTIATVRDLDPTGIQSPDRALQALEDRRAAAAPNGGYVAAARAARAALVARRIAEGDTAAPNGGGYDDTAAPNGGGYDDTAKGNARGGRHTGKSRDTPTGEGE